MQTVGGAARGHRTDYPDLDGYAKAEAATAWRMECWGQLPALTLVASLGLVLVAFADTGARFGAGWIELVFWSGLLALFVPVMFGLLALKASRSERIGLVVLLGLGLYLVKLLNSPTAFAIIYDELIHWRSADDIFQSGHLFRENPLLPVSALYPGLEIVTSGLVNLSGLSIFGAGVLVIGVARLVLALALFRLYEIVSGSARVAGLASLLYMANPNFLFFDGQFAYESLALPLATMALFAAVRRARDANRAQFGLTLVVVLSLTAVVITHHVTTYALAGFLLLWLATAAVTVRRLGGGNQQVPAGIALLVVVEALAWMLYVATLVVDYLAPHISGGLKELLRMIAGEESGRQLFRDPTGQMAPAWEQWLGFASVVCILLGLPFGFLQIWRRYRRDAVALALAGGALAYPASLALRLTERGAEASNRTAEFLFVGIAFVLAVGAGARLFRRPNRWSRLIFAIWASVIFMGSIIVGASPVERLPGPYTVAADSRSIEPQGLAVADWVLGYLGSGNRIATDRTNRALLGSYGRQRVVTASTDNLNVPELFFAPRITAEEQEILRDGRIRYVVVDRRLASALPVVGVYFERGEGHMVRQHAKPIDLDVLTKFDGMANVSRIFDSGDIAIYEVEALADADVDAP